MRYFKMQNLFLQRIEPKRSEQTLFYGFRLLGKSKKHWEFYDKRESPINELYSLFKKFCIQSDYDKNFIFLDHIGRGNFAKVNTLIASRLILQVVLVKNASTGRQYAVKCYTKSEIETNPRVKVYLLLHHA